ncbi:SAM-dependent methyltransferase [Chitinibacter bivalviorum]|uniref:SAM-dependent methyltransferase n=1 Tax=Chitinibacter bivalviorum TaxID=2739434 RepID=A0A7H9BK21_9NEIS|nr:SAM-dependent methyltransferase [Chitinibacter bivalviorum]QLG89027.1 SAM-dependent methyltransferase [Chitinibacter bivalviorum]
MRLVAHDMASRPISGKNSLLNWWMCMVASSSAAKTWQWLQSNPTFTELAQAHPQEWLTVRDELAAVFARRDAAELKALVSKAAQRMEPDAKFLSGERDGRAFELFVHHQIRQRLTEQALRQYAFSAATGVKSGKVRFNLLNGLLAQKLLFEKDLIRKPVSMRAFRLIWPLLWQKRLLMPLVEKRGIWCFYSRELIAGLAQLIGHRRTVEIAAGDGTLSRFLAEQGVDITATDDYSWEKVVKYPESVQRLDAISALSRFQPKVVICSWPPSANHFERQIFRQREVETYIVIGSHSRFITGNWADYEAQTFFAWQEHAELSQLILPPELKAGVWVFQRKVSP